MIESRLASLMAEKVLKISEVSQATGISVTSLTDLYYRRSKAIQFRTIESLCKYFNCEVGDLLVLKKDTHPQPSKVV